MSLSRSIASAPGGDYVRTMASAVLRLLALVALVLMPLSMASAPAAAQPVGGVPAGHCDDHQQPPKAPGGQQIHCMACAALPAMDAPAPIAGLTPRMPAVIALESSLSGIDPDTDTPPPKLV